MADVLTPAQRQLNMSNIKSKNSKLEMLIRRGLHARGLRFRLHDQSLPGRPDLVFARYNTAAFIHGCFWHVHKCALSKIPMTQQEFWKTKLTANAARDRQAIDALLAARWRVLVIWECALRGTGRLPEGELLDNATDFIRNSALPQLDIAGSSKSGDANRSP
ncbi:very short patch repair endonuclease [Hydrogenophaga sp. XSHU_21]